MTVSGSRMTGVVRGSCTVATPAPQGAAGEVVGGGPAVTAPTPGIERPCLHKRARHQHGTYLAHDKDGCRCMPCKVATRRRAKRVAFRTATGTSSYVDADPARAHVRELLDAVTVRQIEERSGVHRTAIRVLVGDFPGRPASKRITRKTEAALLAVTGARIGPESGGLVDATGTRRRLRALVALGWPVEQLRARLGVSSKTTWLLTDDGVADDVMAVTVRVRDAVCALYDELSMTLPEPSRARTLAQRRARALSWVPPLAWDDDSIDDPAARPVRGAPEVHGVDPVAVDLAVEGHDVSLTRAERWAAVERLTRRGMPDGVIAQRVGVSENTVQRDRRLLEVASSVGGR